MAGTALLGRLTWRLGAVTALRDETPRVRTIVVDVPDWPEPPAGSARRRVAEFGAQHLYRHPQAPGAVLRCAACGNVLLVLVERRNDFRLTLRGLSWIELKT